MSPDDDPELTNVVRSPAATTAAAAGSAAASRDAIKQKQTQKQIKVGGPKKSPEDSLKEKNKFNLLMGSESDQEEDDDGGGENPED